MVVLASSLLRGKHKTGGFTSANEYKYTPEGTGDYDNDDPDAPFNGGPRYRFPDWAEFRPPSLRAVPRSPPSN